MRQNILRKNTYPSIYNNMSNHEDYYFQITVRLDNDYRLTK